MIYNNNISKNKNNKGFTLAEVLIVLAIIGVVAAITIPALVQSTQKSEFVSGLKKEYSALSQAFNELAQENGGSITDVPGFSSTTNDNSEDKTAIEEFATKLVGLKVCGNDKGCLYTSPLKYLNGQDAQTNLDVDWNNTFGKAVLADGSILIVNIYDSSCKGSNTTGKLYQSICGDVTVDVNGTKGPNQWGRDVFLFWITQSGIYPRGIPQYADGNFCNATPGDAAYSYGCAEKVLIEGAMNY